MKKLNFLLIFLLSFCNIGFSSKQKLIPQPAEYSAESGTFTIPSSWTVESYLPKDVTVRLLDVLKHPFSLESNGNKPTLILEKDPSIEDEGYSLKITPQNVTIAASTEKGIFYGLQSLYQLSSLKIGNPDKESQEILCCTINDYPRFQHRGLMLDVTRYFIPKEEVKKIIDIASTLKFNNLHLHLTDDNGWRMEIKKYPKLTETGAWRVDREEIFPGRMNPVSADEPTPVGGFYTQDDLKEIVDYAGKRYINVIPEIEMPAHAAAAIASYPSFACPVVDKFVGVFPGIGGQDASIIMCAGNDKVLEFYRDVLDEVFEIFPSPYIHLGGDEANKSIWEVCELCNQRIKDENLKDFEDLQGWFMDQINSYVRSKGRTAMGWDEVTYGNPKEDMVIMGWQGDGGIAVKDARKSGRKFIMTPAKTLYLIRYQGPQWFEPYTYFGNNRLKDVYMYEPVGADWTPELKDQLIGIQGSLWTEFCSNPEDVEYLLFPRLVAVADGAWRPEGSADWEGFIEALDGFTPELESRGVNYARSMFNIQHEARPTGNGIEITLENERPDMDIYYFTDNQVENPVKYNGKINITKPTKISAVTYAEGTPKGLLLQLNLDFNKATGKTVTSLSPNNKLQHVLTNGLRGSNRQSDFEWAGWHKNDAEFVIDLGEIQEINNVSLGALGFTHTCVVIPENVELYGSNDGENFTLLSTTVLPQELIYAKEPTIYNIDLGNPDTNARYLKIKAKNPGVIPEGFAREGAGSWLYFDEVIVN